MKTKSKPEPGELRERALRYLARREHSRWELARKLELAGFAVEAIAPLLDEFEEKDWLSDRRFAESYVADHCAKSGGIKLGYELRRRGVSDCIIDVALGAARHTEFERAREVWKKKFGAAPVDARDKARQINFLASRGFPDDIIRTTISRTDENSQ